MSAKGNEKIDFLVEKMKRYKPEERMIIKEAIGQLKSIGQEDISQKRKMVEDFMLMLKKKIKEKDLLAQMNLNTEIQKISQQLIPVLLRESEKDFEFEKYADADEFIQKILFYRDKEKVLLILGSAGSGKSTILQAKYINAVADWKTGKPIPFYMNHESGQ